MSVTVILKSGKEQSVMRRHPWLFSGAIKQIEGKPTEGEIVTVTDNKGNFLAYGHYQPNSIMVRLLTFEQQPIDQAFFTQRITSAYNMRMALGLAGSAETNVYRLIHGEGDGLPGLIIDVYDHAAVVQFHTTGMFLARDFIFNALNDVLGSELTTIYDKSEGTMPFKGPVKAVNEFIKGDQTSAVVKEYGNFFKVDWAEGQKTGFFVDQRENRRLVQQYAKNRSVLNMFGYTGGFSVYAMRGGAKLVHSVDVSKTAIDLTNENIALNFSGDSRHEAFATDAFSYLADIKDKYDLIILDPPAFAKHLNVLDKALQGYKKLNQKALEQIKPGGLLFTFSCSQVVSKENFRKSVFAAAANAKRNVSILYQLSQPADHAINIYHPEGEYLKGLVCYVE
jgi:23S rRNA (cytosine1962-C5)-methyltransferase